MKHTLPLLSALLFAPRAAFHAAAALMLVEPAETVLLTMGIPHFAWRGGPAPDISAMASCEIEIASDDAFGHVPDTDRIAAVISRYVPDKELPPDWFSR